MRDSNGRILIPGFFDDVHPLSESEKAAIAKLPPVEDTLKREFGIGRSEGDDGLTESTMRPAINIRGLAAGKVGAEAVNAIPSKAEVSIDFRLVPDKRRRACGKESKHFSGPKAGRLFQTHRTSLPGLPIQKS